MKYIVVLGDGMADYPIERLGNRTPLQYAKTPNIDALASHAEIGLCRTATKTEQYRQPVFRYPHQAVYPFGRCSIRSLSCKQIPPRPITGGADF